MDACDFSFYLDIRTVQLLHHHINQFCLIIKMWFFTRTEVSDGTQTADNSLSARDRIIFSQEPSTSFITGPNRIQSLLQSFRGNTRAQIALRYILYFIYGVWFGLNMSREIAETQVPCGFEVWTQRFIFHDLGSDQPRGWKISFWVQTQRSVFRSSGFEPRGSKILFWVQTQRSLFSTCGFEPRGRKIGFWV